MIYDAIKDIKNSKDIDKNKLDIVTGLIFEHIFHRTYNFISDELNEFRELKPHVNHHIKHVEWSTPILSSSEKIIKRLKQIGVVISILFTLAMAGNEIYKVASTYFKIDVVMTPKNSSYDKPGTHNYDPENIPEEMPVKR
jgi:hypothetical protein